MRPALLVAGSAALALAGLLVLQRERPAPPRPRTVAPADNATPPLAPAPPVAAPPVADVVALAPSDDAPEMPPPTAERTLPRPEQNEPEPAETREQKLASLDLIARSIERLEQERQDAARAGDSETAGRNLIRIERMRQRSEEIQQELDEPAP